jgi:hypothetical protein
VPGCYSIRYLRGGYTVTKKSKVKKLYVCDYCGFESVYGSGISGHVRHKHPEHEGRGGFTTREQPTHIDPHNGVVDLPGGPVRQGFPAPQVFDVGALRSAITDGFRELAGQLRPPPPEPAPVQELASETEGSPMPDEKKTDETAPVALTEATGKKLCEGLECLKDDLKASVESMGTMLSDHLKSAVASQAQPQSEPQGHSHTRKSDPRADAEAIIREMAECEEHGPHLKRAFLKNFRDLYPNLILRSRESMKKEMEQIRADITKEINASTGKAEDSPQEAPPEAPQEPEAKEAEGTPVSTGQADGAGDSQGEPAAADAPAAAPSVEPPATAAPGDTFTAPDGRVCEVGADGKSYCFDKYGV